MPPARRYWGGGYIHTSADTVTPNRMAINVTILVRFEFMVEIPLRKGLRAERAVCVSAVNYMPTLDAVQARYGNAASRPLVSVDPGTRLTHQLRLVDEGSPTRRGKPEGVAGAEVWVKLVDAGTPAPTDPAALSFLTLTSRPTARTEFRAMMAGRWGAAVYMLRWVNTGGGGARREGAVVGYLQCDGDGVKPGDVTYPCRFPYNAPMSR